jgi:hypothetical protein
MMLSICVILLLVLPANRSNHSSCANQSNLHLFFFWNHSRSNATFYPCFIHCIHVNSCMPCPSWIEFAVGSFSLHYMNFSRVLILHICAGEWSSRRRRRRGRSGRGMIMNRGSWSLPRARLNISRTNTGGGSTARRLSRTAPSQGDIFIILLMSLCVCYFIY